MFVGAVVHHVGFDFVEIIFRIIAWAVQIGCVLLLAAILAGIGWAVEEAIRKKRGRFLPRFFVALLLICVLLAVFALNPPVICPERYESYLTPERRDAVQSGVHGVYNWNIPLVPVCIRITGVDNFIKDGSMEYSLEYTVYYFCLGSMRMEYSTYDGYSSHPMFGS